MALARMEIKRKEFDRAVEVYSEVSMHVRPRITQYAHEIRVFLILLCLLG